MLTNKAQYKQNIDRGAIISQFHVYSITYQSFTRNLLQINHQTLSAQDIKA